MDVERWERVKELFEAALERDEPERSPFLDHACATDAELRREVDSLLSGEKKLGDFLQQPVARIPLTAPANDHPPTTFSPGDVVSGRFKILRFIGRGGMGEVYEARDLERNVRVALKTVRPEIASNPKTMARFNKEIDLALLVTHRNVCRVYHLERHRPPKESGEPEVVFLTMELLEGETLADRLRRQGRMSYAQALPLIRQMAEGLAAAHKEGVVHCDFKPGNVMLVSERPLDVDSIQSTQSIDLKRDLTPDQAKSAAEGSPANASVGAGATVRAVITDFGLARAMRPMLTRESIQESLDTGDRLVGTLPYMAPEQLEGHPATPASDVYAFGLAIYEMVTGRQPFSGETPMSAIYRRLQAAPPRPRTLAPGLDPGLESIILRCLERDPGLRYSNAGELIAALANPSEAPPPFAQTVTWTLAWVLRRRVWLTAGLALVALLLIILRFESVGRAAGGNLVVLPLTAVAGQGDDEAYCDGFTETLTTQLGRSPSLAIPPAFEVRKRHVDSAEEAGREFGAKFVLKGTWQRQGEDVRINLALIDTRTLRQIHTTFVDGKLGELFRLQNQVVEAAVGLLDVEVPTTAQEGTAESAAYDYYIKGRGYLQAFQKPERVESAINAFQAAIQLDDRYGLAHAGLGEGYWRRFELTRNPQLVKQARDECTKATSLNNSGAEAYVCLGTVYNGTGQYEQAADQFQRAIDLEPTNDDGYIGLAQAYEGLNKIERAAATYAKAIALRPERVTGYEWLGKFYLDHQKFQDAADTFNRVLQIAPDDYVGRNDLGAAYLAESRYSDSIAQFEKSLSIRPTYFAYSNLGTAYFGLRRFPEAARSYESALRISDAEYAVWGNLGDAYTWAPGEHDKAEKAYREAALRAGMALKVNPRDYSASGYLATYYAMLGDRARALGAIEEALRLAPSDADTMLNAAHVYGQLGDGDQEISWLQKAVAAGCDIAEVRDSPYFDNVRENPRFQALLNGKITPSGGGT